MSTQITSDEAVEAVAQVLLWAYARQGDIGDDERSGALDTARAALEDAVPFIREQIASEIEAARPKPIPAFSGHVVQYRNGMNQAARIARGES